MVLSKFYVFCNKYINIKVGHGLRTTGKCGFPWPNQQRTTDVECTVVYAGAEYRRTYTSSYKHWAENQLMLCVHDPANIRVSDIAI